MRLDTAIKRLEKLSKVTKTSTSISKTIYEDIDCARTNDDYVADMGNGFVIEFSCESKDKIILDDFFVVKKNGNREFPKNLKQAIEWCQ